MSEPNEVSHPSLKQFKSALDRKKVDRALMETFDRWRNNPAKCAPESDLKAAVDALWARFQTEMGGKPSAPSTAQRNSTPKPSEKKKFDRGPGQGRGPGRGPGR
jgi:hypothetical protein